MDKTELEALTSEWIHLDWWDDLITLSKSPPQTSPNRDAIKEIKLRIKSAQNMDDYQNAFNWFGLGLVLDSDAILSAIEPDLVPIKTKIENYRRFIWWLKRSTGFAKCAALDENTVRYLDSLANFGEAWRLAGYEEKELERLIRSDVPLAFNLLIGRVEESFMPINHHRKGISKEDLASYASYILGRYKDLFLNEPNLCKPLTELPSDAFFNKLVSLARKLWELRQQAALVGRLGYRCVKLNSHEYVIRHPNEQQDMALHFGYVISRLNGQTKAIKYFEETPIEIPTLTDVAERFAKEFKNEFFKEKTTFGFTRLSIEIPEPIAKVLSEKLLGDNRFYKDEGYTLRSSGDKLLATFDEMRDFKIAPDISLVELFRMTRIFRFLSHIIGFTLDGRNNALLLHNTLVKYLDRNSLLSWFQINGVSRKRAEECLNLLVWDAKYDNKILDFQYSPIIKINDIYVPFLNVLTYSDIFRNQLYKHKLRIDSDGQIDSIGRPLAETLKSSMDFSQRKIPYEWKGEKGDIDVMATYEDCLYLFECKNSLLPCDMFELRTFYDYLNEASQQLTRITDLFFDNGFRKYISKKIDRDLNGIKEIRTCIVTNARLYAGMSFQGHSVRPFLELEQFISEGNVRMGILDNERKDVKNIKLWEGENLSNEDMKKYLSGNFILYKAAWDAAEQAEKVLNFAYGRITKRTYGFHLDRYQRAVGFKASED